jgi:hypothetical protein
VGNACTNGGIHNSHHKYNQTKHRFTTHTCNNHPCQFFELYGHPSHEFPKLTLELFQGVCLACMQHNKISSYPFPTSTLPLPKHAPITPSGEVPCTSTSFVTPHMGNPPQTKSTSQLRFNHVDLGEPLPYLVPQCLLDLILLRKMKVYTHTHHGPSPLIGINLSKNEFHLLPHFKYNSSLKTLHFISV